MMYVLQFDGICREDRRFRNSGSRSVLHKLSTRVHAVLGSVNLPSLQIANDRPVARPSGTTVAGGELKSPWKMEIRESSPNGMEILGL